MALHKVPGASEFLDLNFDLKILYGKRHSPRVLVLLNEYKPMFAVLVHQKIDIKAQQKYICNIPSKFCRISWQDKHVFSALLFFPPPKTSNKNILHKQIPNYN